MSPSNLVHTKVWFLRMGEKKQILLMPLAYEAGNICFQLLVLLPAELKNPDPNPTWELGAGKEDRINRNS